VYILESWRKAKTDLQVRYDFSWDFTLNAPTLIGVSTDASYFVEGAAINQDP